LFKTSRAKLPALNSHKFDASRSPQAEGHDRISSCASFFLYFPHQRRFEFIRIDINFTCGDLLCCSAVETQFADAKTSIRTHWWTKKAARHGTSRVQITGASRWIQHGTGFIVGELVECCICFRRIIQEASLRITRKLG
jgi:hypothetical protein